MFFDGEIKTLGVARLDPAEVLRLVEAQPKLTWQIGPQRQELFDVHRQTLSIILRFSGEDSYEYLQYPAWDTFSHLLQPVFDQAAEFLGYSDYDICRAMFASLRPGGIITAHADSAPIYDYCHRLHVPIKTSDKSSVLIDHNVHRLDTGILYEINNRLLHGAFNHHDDEDRIHLIFDLFSREAPAQEVAH